MPQFGGNFRKQAQTYSGKIATEKESELKFNESSTGSLENGMNFTVFFFPRFKVKTSIKIIFYSIP